MDEARLLIQVTFPSGFPSPSRGFTFSHLRADMVTPTSPPTFLIIWAAFANGAGPGRIRRLIRRHGGTR